MTLFIKCIKMPKKSFFAQCVGLNIELQLASMLHFLSMAHSIRRPQVCYTFARVLHAKHGFVLFWFIFFCFAFAFAFGFCFAFGAAATTLISITIEAARAATRV